MILELKETEVCNFADDTTPSACEVLLRLEHDSALSICWVESNYTKLNTDKCHLVIAGNNKEHIWAKVDNEKIWESNSVKLLGIAIDNKLNFNKHVTNV